MARSTPHASKPNLTLRLVVPVVALVAAGCGSGGGDSSLDDLVASMDADQRMGEIVTADEAAEIVSMRTIVGADDDARAQIANIESFWIDVGADLDLAYQPLDDARLAPRSVLEATGPLSCSDGDESTELTAELTAFNALVARCPVEGITVLWDDIDLKPFLDRTFPEAGFAQLMAHEWGHVVQHQLPFRERSTLLAEQQADCYAGAYIRWAEGAGLEPFTTPRARDLAVLSALESRDQVGTSPTDPNAHGNGFDRVRAVQEGYDSGVTICAAYDDEAPPYTQMAFASEEQAAMGGNLAFDEAVALLDPTLASYFEGISDEPIAPFVQLPGNDVLEAQHGAIGDGAVATLLGLNYAGGLQLASDIDPNGAESALQRACLFGSFLNRALAGDVIVDGTDGPTPFALSPGDLDETITSLATSPAIVSNAGLIFEVVAALRIGTIEGLEGCGLED